MKYHLLLKVRNCYNRSITFHEEFLLQTLRSINLYFHSKGVLLWKLTIFFHFIWVFKWAQKALNFSKTWGLLDLKICTCLNKELIIISAKFQHIIYFPSQDIKQCNSGRKSKNSKFSGPFLNWIIYYINNFFLLKITYGYIAE